MATKSSIRSYLFSKGVDFTWTWSRLSMPRWKLSFSRFIYVLPQRWGTVEEVWLDGVLVGNRWIEVNYGWLCFRLSKEHFTFVPGGKEFCDARRSRIEHENSHSFAHSDEKGGSNV